MTDPVSPNSLLSGKRIVVVGDDPLRHSLYNSLTSVFDRAKLDLAADEDEAREILWMAGDSNQLSDSTHLVVVSNTTLYPEEVFRIHCRCRPNDRQDATLESRGPGWSGGIVFIGPNTRDLHELAEMEPFHRIRAGHAVIPSTTLLLKILLSIARLKPIYPSKWKETLLSLEGLARLKVILKNLEKKSPVSTSDLRTLLDALRSLLADDLLGKLLAHREVIGKLRELVRAMDSAIGGDTKYYSINFANGVRTILADYF